MITMLYAGVCTLLVLVLAYRVVQVRRSAKVGLGDGGNDELQRRIRIHANALENLPLALILLGGAELNGYPDAMIHGFGAALLVSRIAHAIGMSGSSGYSRGRFFGTLGTWLVMAALAIIAITGYLSGLR